MIHKSSYITPHFFSASFLTLTGKVAFFVKDCSPWQCASGLGRVGSLVCAPEPGLGPSKEFPQGADVVWLYLSFSFLAVLTHWSFSHSSLSSEHIASVVSFVHMPNLWDHTKDSSKILANLSTQVLKHRSELLHFRWPLLWSH